MDARGQPEISQNILAKILFRVAHWWCTNIDLEEYVDMLQRIYARITYKKAYFCQTESVKEFFPKIQISFPLEEKRISETVVRGGVNADTDWMECASNESNKSQFDYKYEEDPDQMVVKKYKKKRPEGASGPSAFDYSSSAQAQLTIKEPFIFNEEILYPELNDPRHNDMPNKTIYDCLLPFDQVLPFGYPTEQYFRQVKQDIHTRLEEQRNIHRSGSQTEDQEGPTVEKDPGLLEHESGMFIEVPVKVWGLTSTPTGGVTIVARVTDTLFNQNRK